MTTIVAAYFSARWAARWATREAFRQRWWERKERAYSEIVESLYDMTRYLDLCAEESLNPDEAGREHPRKREFSEKYSEAYWRIERATDIGAFIISEEAANVLMQLRKRPKLHPDENPPWELYEEDSEHYRDALARIRELARKDLTV